MRQEETEQNNIRRHRRQKSDDQFIYLRQWLNIIFMIGAVVGMALYFFADKTVGTIIILCAMVFKIVECSLRFFH